MQLSIPPGIVKNGTPYSRRGRWEDSNLVRWHNGAIRQIGGWLRSTTVLGAPIPPVVADPAAEVVRDMFSWRSLDNSNQALLGSNLALYHLSEAGTVTDISPAGINTSVPNADVASGYGIGLYSFGPYGIFTPTDNSLIVPPQRWVFDTFGELGLAAQRGFGPIFEVNPNNLNVAPVTNAPTAVQDIIVTEQRIVFTLGAGGEQRLVKWSDQENRNVWTPELDNQAGEFFVQGQGRLLSAISVLQQVLIVGENDATTARYVGPPYVFSFDIAGRNCGAIAAEAVVGTDRFAVWWGDGRFWMFDGGIRPLPCDVQDFLNLDLNKFQASKITAITNQEFSEVWWFYQSNGSNEVDSYVAWCYLDNTWWTGKLNRSAGFDNTVYKSPRWIGTDGILYTHEQAGVLVDGQAYIESAGIDFAPNLRNSALRYVFPDTQAFGDVTMTVFSRQFPTGPEFSHGPYPYNNPTPTRALGRDMRFRFDGKTANFEVGTMRLDLSPLPGGLR